MVCSDDQIVYNETNVDRMWKDIEDENNIVYNEKNMDRMWKDTEDSTNYSCQRFGN